MNGKKWNIAHTAYLILRGEGIVDFVTRYDELRALEAFDDLVDEANLDTFGEGIYEVSMMREYFDETGRFIKCECLKKIIIDRGDEL